MRKTVAFLLALALLPALALSARAAQPEDTAALPAGEEAVLHYGGVPGQINILLNGQCIAFPDAVPESRGGRTMVPLRAAMEAMGAAVTYDAATNSAVVTGETVHFRHVIGTREIVLPGGETMEMDVASYAENGRTMVPVRFFSQVLGFDVFWDNECRMVYLLDRAAVTAALDEPFGVLNAWLAARAAQGGAEIGCTVTAALSGTLHPEGAAEQDFSARLESLRGGGGISAEVSGALSALAEAAKLLGAQEIEGAALDTLSLRMIANEAEDCVFLGGESAEAAFGCAPGTWLRLDNAGIGTGGSASSLGAALYEAMLESADANHFEPAYARFTQTLPMALRAMVGDELFRETGSGHAAASQPEAEGLRDLRVRVTLKKDGTAKLSASFALGGADGAAAEVSLSAKLENGKAVFELSVKSEGRFALEGKLSVRSAQSDSAAALFPPEGSTVVPLRHAN